MCWAADMKPLTPNHFTYSLYFTTSLKSLSTLSLTSVLLSTGIKITGGVKRAMRTKLYAPISGMKKPIATSIFARKPVTVLTTFPNMFARFWTIEISTLSAGSLISASQAWYGVRSQA
ncbi:MAG: hypothetical protein QW753_05775 [Thermofilum sp.]